MRKILFVLLLLQMVSCASVARMNQNMETTNVLMKENIQAMEASKKTIEENTKEIKKSTEAMRDFQYVFPIFFSILLLIFVFLIFQIYRKMAKLPPR